MFAGNSRVTGGKPRSVAERYKKCVFSSILGWVRPKTRDKWRKVSHDAGSALIPDVMVHVYRFDCYATSHWNLASIMGALASITNLRILDSPFFFCVSLQQTLRTRKRLRAYTARLRALHSLRSMASTYFPYGTYSYLWSGRDSDLVKHITRRDKTRGIQWYPLFWNWVKNKRVIVKIRGSKWDQIDFSMVNVRSH